MIRHPVRPSRSPRGFACHIRTSDGFSNFAARLGLDQDNLLAHSSYRRGKNITANKQELDEMYRSSWVVARMVEVVAEDMTRSAMDIQGSLTPGEVSELHRAYRATGIPGRLTDAVKWGRLYGGALAVILIDGQDPSLPLELDQIPRGGFRGLYVLDRHEITPSPETIGELGPMLGYPLYYTLNSAGGPGDGLYGMRVHHSRVLRCIGVDLPGESRRVEQSWGASVVERAYDRILALDSATHGAANLMYRSFLRVIHVKRLREILAAGGRTQQALEKMFAMIRLMQSNEGITLLDGEDTFSTHGWTFAGMYDALQAFAEQIGGATGIPLVRLLGQSPKGFSSGESDLRIYYDTILTQVEDDRRPLDIVLLNILSRHLWGRALPDDATVEYQSLYTPTEVEKSQIATADAQGVAGLHQANIIGKARALSELKDAGRLTGRFGSVTDKEIEEAEKEDAAPPLPEGMAEEGGLSM